MPKIEKSGPNDAALRELRRAAPHAHDRRTRRIAVTFEVEGHGRPPGELPGHPVTPEACRLYALTHRWCRDRRGAARPAVALAILVPGLDAEQTGRIRYRVGRVVDLLDPEGADALGGRDLGAAALLARAVADAAPEGLDDGLLVPTPLFAFRAAWPTADRLPGDRDGGPDPGILRPDVLLLELGHLRGRRIRNPAFEVLKGNGLIPARLGYRAWLDSLGLAGDLGRRPADTADPASPAGRLRDAISAFATSGPAAERALFGDMRAACRAAGIPVPGDADGVDLLARLLDAPWERPELPDAAAVQVLRLAGGPSPATMTFADGATTVDLFDLGDDRGRFVPASPAAIRRALGRPARRRGEAGVAVVADPAAIA